ncbi:histidinol dehydrogenase [Conexibacter sp. S30A1]|uniref:histidinol dehydrogenase n=1 Tax=Conexibacter sp. S30A1 TaxID=2937800 RepID=UPI00200BD5E5|nr:histidinol dehydrogenase [Conexibacter sp. S30A1]
MSTALATDLQDYDRRDLAERVAEVVNAVRRQGDAAVSKAATVHGAAELTRYVYAIPSSVAADIRLIQRRLTQAAAVEFSSLTDVETEVSVGTRMGVHHVAVDSLGVCLADASPRGVELGVAEATVIIARAAGVRRVIACLPPDHDGKPSALVAATLALAGVDTMHCVGGVQGLAALAFGTETIPRVDLLVGVGDPALDECVRQLSAAGCQTRSHGVLVVADESAPADLIAADLIAAGECDPTGRGVLITTSPELAETVHAAVERQLITLPNIETVRCAWRRLGAINVVDGPDKACELANRYAVERVEVLTRDPRAYMGKLSECSELLLGQGAGVALANPVVSREPAHFSSGGTFPSVKAFMRSIPYRVAESAARDEIEALAQRCRMTGQEAHARACERRAPQEMEHAGAFGRNELCTLPG